MSGIPGLPLPLMPRVPPSPSSRKNPNRLQICHVSPRGQNRPPAENRSLAVTLEFARCPFCPENPSSACTLPRRNLAQTASFRDPSKSHTENVTPFPAFRGHPGEDSPSCTPVLTPDPHNTPLLAEASAPPWNPGRRGPRRHRDHAVSQKLPCVCGPHAAVSPSR